MTTACFIHLNYPWISKLRAWQGNMSSRHFMSEMSFQKTCTEAVLIKAPDWPSCGITVRRTENKWRLGTITKPIMSFSQPLIWGKASGCQCGSLCFRLAYRGHRPLVAHLGSPHHTGHLPKASLILMYLSACPLNGWSIRDSPNIIAKDIDRGRPWVGFRCPLE